MYQENDRHTGALTNLNADEAMTELKNRIQHVTSKELIGFYNSGIHLLKKFQATDQIAAAKKLLFHLECCEKEMKLIEMGIDTFIYADDIKYYMKRVATDDVRLIELELYEREIPDEVVALIQKIRPLFTSLWVLYTDYAHSEKEKIEQKKTVEQVRISKDPILFGVMLDEENRTMNERYYFLADWIDEYCTLTLEKFLDQMRKNGKPDVSHHIETPEDLTNMKAQFDSLKLINGEYVMVNEPKHTLVEKPNFFRKIRTFWKGR